MFLATAGCSPKSPTASTRSESVGVHEGTLSATVRADCPRTVFDCNDLKFSHGEHVLLATVLPKLHNTNLLDQQ